MRCANGGVSASLEGKPALSRLALVALVLIGAAIIASGAWYRSYEVAPTPSKTPAPVPAAADAPPATFAGASPARVFLSQSDSEEAARQGLVPKGTRSVLATGGPMSHGTWRWDEAGVPAGQVTVRVDIERQLVSVFRGRDEIGTAVVVYGAKGKETPRGKLPILGKSRDHHSRTYDAPMPFSLWLREDGVALHGSNVRMGRATNGCIGVPVEFAGKLFEVARKGDIIEVVGNPKSG